MELGWTKTVRDRVSYECFIPTRSTLDEVGLRVKNKTRSPKYETSETSNKVHITFQILLLEMEVVIVGVLRRETT